MAAGACSGGQLGFDSPWSSTVLLFPRWHPR